MIKGILNFIQVNVGFGFDVESKQALQYFRDKGLRPSFSYADVTAQEHQHAFTVAKMLDMDLLKDVQDSLYAALAEGLTFDQWKDRIIPTLQANGWWGRQAVVDPITGKTVIAELGSARRLQTIFRTNMQSAYAVGQWQKIQEQAKEAPYLMYDAVDDFRTRPQHRAWDNKILPITATFWTRYYPPNGWGCRCGVIQLSQDDVDSMGLSVSDDPDIKWVNWKNPRTGKVERIPEGIDAGFQINAGMEREKYLKKLAKEKAEAIADDLMRDAAKIGLRNQPNKREFDTLEPESIINEWIGKSALKMEEDLFLDLQITSYAEKYGLNMPEQMAIRHYTETGNGINAFLLGELTNDPKRNKILESSADILRTALQKLPNHEGFVVSRLTLPDHFVKKMKRNSTVLFPAFTSADDEADAFPYRKHRLIIESKTGKKIKWISGHAKTESEVLFTSPTWFKVLDVEQKPDNEVWFYLEEVLP